MKITVSAPGRVCLFGEHMDWCGHYVIPAAIDMRVYVEVHPIAGKTVKVHSFKPFQTYAAFDLRDTEINRASDLRYVHAVHRALLSERNIHADKAFNLMFAKAEEVANNRNLIDASRSFEDLPVQKGLSSSAALCVTVAAAIDLTSRFSSSSSTPRQSDFLASSLTNTISQNLTRYANLAYVGERKILGINCGQMDQYSSAYGGVLFIDCRSEPPEVERLEVKNSIPIIVGDTKQPKDTARILGWLGERLKNCEKTLMDGVKGITDVVLEAKKEFEKPSLNLRRIGELMDLNQQYASKNLRISGDCPISPSNLDKLIEAARNAGALGAKVSGCGGGGCMVALCEREEQRKEIAEAIRKAGGKAYQTSIAERGVRLESLEP